MSLRPIRPARMAGAGILCCALALAPIQPAAQQTGARETRLSVDQRLEWNDNPDLEVNGEAQTLSRTTLGLTHIRRTSIDTFQLNLGGQLETGTDGLTGSALQDPAFRLSFARDVRHARVNANYSYRETDVSSTLTDQTTGGVFSDTGTRRSTNAGLSGELGIGAPLGAAFTLRRSTLRYSGTSDPSLLDEDIDALRGTVFFRPNQAVTIGTFTEWRDQDVAGNGVDRETVIFGTSVDAVISPVLTANLTVSYDTIDLSGGGALPSTEEGLSTQLGLTFLRPNGTVQLNLASDVRENGQREFIRLRRDMTLPRGNLGLSVGATRNDAQETDPLFGIDWTRSMPRGSLNLSLTQQVTSDALANDQILTRLSFSAARDLTSRAQISLRANLLDENELGIGAIDTRRVDVSITYTQALERDWNLVGGYRHSLAIEDGLADRSSNALFIGLQKNFVWN